MRISDWSSDVCSSDLLILPNAKIIDVRRHPVSCCFSNFTTYFNLQTSVPNSLEDLARHYRSYIRMVSNFDAILHGRIHLVQYERVIEDIEGEVRRILAYLKLPYAPEIGRATVRERVGHDG